jgi:hypothetical protein
MSHAVHTHISHLSLEHNTWLRGVEFYMDELKVQTHRLEEVSSRYTSPEVKSQVEHYENQFKIQKLNLQELRHDVNEHVKHISDDTVKYAQHLSNTTLAEHDAMRDRFVTLEKIINEIRHDFYRFLSANM